MISALVLAAGESTRMGQPKMALPWGTGTVLGQVITTLKAAHIDDILVVTGGSRGAVDKIAGDLGARTVFNPEYARGELVSSELSQAESPSP